MLTVRFVADYRGVLTGERYYQSGAVADFADVTAQALIGAGRVQLVAPPVTEHLAEDDESPAPKRAGRRKRGQ